MVTKRFMLFVAVAAVAAVVAAVIRTPFADDFLLFSTTWACNLRSVYLDFPTARFSVKIPSHYRRPSNRNMSKIPQGGLLCRFRPRPGNYPAFSV